MSNPKLLRKESHDRAQRIESKIPRHLLDPVLSFPPTRPNTPYFKNSDEERKHLYEVADLYRRLMPKKQLFAHGTWDLATLCQILDDRELLHIKGVETYGTLGNSHAGSGGHWDNGAGIFVVRESVVMERRYNAQHPNDNKMWSVPLEMVDAVILPKGLCPIIKEEFPEHEKKLFNFDEYTKIIWKQIRLRAWFENAKEFLKDRYYRLEQALRDM